MQDKIDDDGVLRARDRRRDAPKIWATDFTPISFLVAAQKLQQEIFSVENRGIDPRASRMRIERSTI